MKIKLKSIDVVNGFDTVYEIAKHGEVFDAVINLQSVYLATINGIYLELHCDTGRVVYLSSDCIKILEAIYLY